MAYDRQRLIQKARKHQAGDSMAMAATSLHSEASEKDVREAVAEVVSQMLDSLPAIITWFISDDFAAKLVARVVDAVGQTILSWIR